MEKHLLDGIKKREARSQEIDDYSIIQNSPPKAVKIEVSSLCNFRCQMCYNRYADLHGMLLPNDFDIILANIVEFNIKQVGVLFLGESTLNPLLSNYICKLKTAGIEYVFLTTNGYYVKEGLLVSLINAGLDSLKWSVNYFSPKSFSLETQQQESQFFQIVENIKRAKKYRDSQNATTRLYMSCVVDDVKHVLNEQAAFINSITPYVDEVVLNDKTNHGGLVGDVNRCSCYDVGHPCPRLFNNMYIRSNLDVVCCCNGFTDDFKIGSLKSSSLQDLWNCQQMQDLRKSHLYNIECAPCAFKTQNIKQQ